MAYLRPYHRMKRCAIAAHQLPVPAYALVRFKPSRGAPWMEAALCMHHCTVVRDRVASGELWRGQVLRVLEPEMQGRHKKFKPFPRPPHLERIGDVSST